MSVIEEFNSHIMGTYGRYELVIDKGEGDFATDDGGKRYIDFGSGIGTNSLGYADKDWADAVCKQVRTLQHTSNYYYTKVQAEFAAKLAELTGTKKMFFCNSGAEANECAIKLARKYSFDKYGKDRHNIITLVNSFHGRTLATLSATGQDVFHNYFFPFVEGFIYAEANNISDLREKLDSTVCAVMIEYIQGEGGVIPLEKEYVDELYRVCGEMDVLVITDEVQTGVGRTGKFLAGQYYGHSPDIVTLAKGIAGGLPMGVCLAGEKCADTLTAGTHGSTFGGNPVACAGGLEVLKKAGDVGFLRDVAAKGVYIKQKLQKLDEVESVSGMGLMIGIKLRSKNAGEVVRAALDEGLLLLTAKDKVRLLPPLTITYEEIDKGLKILEKLLTEKGE